MVAKATERLWAIGDIVDVLETWEQSEQRGRSMHILRTVSVLTAIIFSFIGHSKAQEPRDIRCDAIKLSWTRNGNFAVINAYNGCVEGAVYVAVCITLANETRVSRQTVDPVPYGQTAPITIGMISDIDLNATVPWTAWSRIPQNPCK